MSANAQESPCSVLSQEKARAWDAGARHEAAELRRVRRAKMGHEPATTARYFNYAEAKIKELEGALEIASTITVTQAAKIKGLVGALEIASTTTVTQAAKIKGLVEELEIADRGSDAQAAKIVELEDFNANAIAVIKQSIDAEMERKEAEENAPPLSWPSRWQVTKITPDGKVLRWDGKTLLVDLDLEDGGIIGKVVLNEKTAKWVAAFNDDSSDDDWDSDEDAFGQFAPGVAGHGGEEEDDDSSDDDRDSDDDWCMYD